MRSLAYRRHQWERAKGRAVRYLRRLFSEDTQWINPKRIARHAVDRTVCSCAMCGDPRHFTGDATRQEIRSANGPRFW